MSFNYYMSPMGFSNYHCFLSCPTLLRPRFLVSAWVTSSGSGGVLGAIYISDSSRIPSVCIFFRKCTFCNVTLLCLVTVGTSLVYLSAVKCSIDSGWHRRLTPPLAEVAPQQLALYIIISSPSRSRHPSCHTVLSSIGTFYGLFQFE